MTAKHAGVSAGTKLPGQALVVISFQIRAYTRDGQFAFGATLHCRDLEAAIERFRTLPLDGHAAELIQRDQIIAKRGIDEV